MERHEIAEQKAEHLVRSGLKQLHSTEADLETRPKGDKRKVKLGHPYLKKHQMAEKAKPVQSLTSGQNEATLWIWLRSRAWSFRVSVSCISFLVVVPCTVGQGTFISPHA
jgi:hypothetical protein